MSGAADRGGTRRRRGGDDDPDLIDYGLLWNAAGFALRSVRRHPLLSSAAFLLTIALTAALTLAWPRTYRVQAVVQALRNPSLPTLANAGWSRPYESDAPTRAARETVLRRDSLVELVEQANLVERWRAERPALLRAVDVVRGWMTRPETHDEKVDALVEVLEEKLAVAVTDTTVTLTLHWPNAATAYEIVDRATRSFLEARHETETAIVADAISIIETHAADLQRRIEAEVARARAGNVAQALRDGSSRGQRNAEVARLQAALAAKRRMAADIEDYRRRRLGELQAQLASDQAVYAAQHPTHETARQSMKALLRPSPEVTALEREVGELEQQLTARGAVIPRDRADGIGGGSKEPIDPRDEYERSRIGALVAGYAGALERLDAARVELDASRAAFKYRYGVLSPPQLPKKPLRPSRVRILLAGCFASLLVAVLAAAWRDARSGVLHEPWQLRRAADAPVLLELRG